MANIRMSRIDSEIQKSVANIINNKLNNPILAGKVVSVLYVDTTPDLILSTITISVLGGDEDKVVDALNACKGHIRSELAKTIRLKTFPDIKFVKDTSQKYAAHMNELFQQIEGQNHE